MPPRPTAPPPVATPLGKKVLIVDDDAVILKTTSVKLESQGYAVVTANDASSAIRAARQEQPDLILLDLSFPPDVGAVAWDGFRIMGWLRRLEEARDIPVIVVTGRDAASCKERSLAAGAVAFFPKPVEAGPLLTAIEQHTQAQHARQPKRLATADFQI
jgi:CheY-like chemotaxis protein